MQLTITDRFRAKVLHAPSGCHLWTAAKGRRGYGRIKVGGKDVRAHRLAWELAHGPIPEGLMVLHVCDRPECVNADHLFLGTHADNMADRNAKGRQARQYGEQNGRARLARADVLEIRERLAAGETQAAIAGDFGVSRQMIGHIKTGRKWRHLCG